MSETAECRGSLTKRAEQKSLSWVTKEEFSQIRRFGEKGAQKRERERYKWTYL